MSEVKNDGWPLFSTRGEPVRREFNPIMGDSCYVRDTGVVEYRYDGDRSTIEFSFAEFFQRYGLDGWLLLLERVNYAADLKPAYNWLKNSLGDNFEKSDLKFKAWAGLQPRHPSP